MGRMYVASFTDIAVSAAQDLFEIQAPADAVVVIHGVWIGNQDIETSEQKALKFLRGEGSITGGSGGSSVTPVPTSKGDAAFGGTVERNNTTAAVAGSGALKDLGAFGANIVGGMFEWIPTPEMRHVISPSDYFIVNLPTAPAASTKLSGTVLFEEIGG